METVNRITITNIEISNNRRIDVQYNVSGEITKYFSEYPFFIEYSQSIKGCPQSIAVIPFLCQILPISWIWDAEIICPELDEDFFNSISEFKKGYANMYPNIVFKGSLIIGNTQLNNNTTTGASALAFFSGGVDSWHTLLRHIDEKPCLMTLWGSDITIDNEAGWQKVSDHIEQTSKVWDLNYCIIKSSFRKIINEVLLSEKVQNLTNDNWWHGFQHGIGIISHSAPLAYSNKANIVYIASTFTEDFHITCASDPTIDNQIRFCDCSVSHDGYEFERQGKVHQIISMTEKENKPVNIRVCWESKGGENCCHCEKCLRTIMNILAERKDPHSYGFSYQEAEFCKLTKLLHRFFALKRVRLYYYYNIQQTFIHNWSPDECPVCLRWFYEYDFTLYAQGKFQKGEHSIAFIFSSLEMFKRIMRGLLGRLRII